MFRLDHDIALVTGCSGGLGMAQCRALGAAGARLIVTDRRPEDAERAAHTLESEGLDVRASPLDVLDVVAIDAVFTDLAARSSTPSILVNNAGVSFRNAALETTEREFDLTFGVNAKGPYFVAQAAARRMKDAGGGAIVNIASIGALVIDGPRSSVYDGSKAAIARMTANLAYEWAAHGIRVNAIAPGYIHTEMTRGLLPTPEVERELVRTRIPLGRVGEPEDLMGAVTFLSSAASSWMTGQTLVVDGGWTAAY